MCIQMMAECRQKENMVVVKLSMKILNHEKAESKCRKSEESPDFSHDF